MRTDLSNLLDAAQAVINDSSIPKHIRDLVYDLAVRARKDADSWD